MNKNEPALLEKVNQILATAKTDGSLEKNASCGSSNRFRPISDRARLRSAPWLISSTSCRCCTTPTCCCAAPCSPWS
ncbi:hypothetical protein QNM99_05055 [Pseudomonas sp. PCH446]